MQYLRKIFVVQKVIKKHYILMCPSCPTQYRVPEVFQGRNLACKKCGTVFKIDFKATPQQGKAPPSPSDVQADIEKISREDHGLVIGKLAIRYHLATKEQVRDAIDLQEQKKREGEKLPLGKILILQRVLDRKQLRFLVSVQSLAETRKADHTFGTIAVKNDFTTRDHIDQALREQQRLFKEKGFVVPIGDLLVKNEVLTGQQRDAILARQKRMQEAPEAGKDEDKAEETPPEKEKTEDIGLILRVSEDKLTAWIMAEKDGLSHVTIDSLKAFIQSRGIVFGIVDDARIIEYLNASPDDRGSFKIAEGTPPTPFDKRDIQYLFNTDPLSIGKIREGNHIDFKDRGPIPQVNENDLLAEKVRTRKDHDGMDVFGRPIPAPKTAEPPFRCGKGTRMSDDGLKIFAAARGRPELSPDGKVSVFAELKIQGDVDLKTGHVDFDGDVIVSGTVRSGFRVNCGSLSAREILHAELETKGNVLVSEGIIGAVIRAGGNVRARHIRESNVEALGDVVVEKEILDTRIETSGSIVAGRSSILSSHIAAKKGIQAYQIGSEKSNPCTLVVGVDTRVRHEVKALKQNTSSKKDEAKGLQKRLESLQGDSKKIQTDLGTMAQEQDRAMVQTRQLKEKRDDVHAKGDSGLLTQIEATLEDIEKENAEREKRLEDIFKEQDRIEEETVGLQEKIAVCEREIGEIEQEISDLLAWSQSEKGIPKVRVHGSIFPYTTIKGRNASLRLPEKHENILAQEAMTRDENDRSQYKIRLTRP